MLRTVPRAIRRSLGRKLLAAVGLPSVAFALGLVAWMRHRTRLAGPGLDPAFHEGLVVLVLFAGAVTAIHVLATRYMLGRPLRALMAALRHAREGEFLYRVPVESEDELGALAREFNTTLAAITDLHARRIDDQASLASMQREVELKRALEARLGELTLLFDLSRRLASTLELERLIGIVTELVGRGLGEHSFALLLTEEGTGDLVVRGVSGLPAEVGGTRIGAGEGPAGWVARERHTLHVPDTSADPRRPLLPWQHGAAGAILAVPLIHQEACTGVLACFRPTPHGFLPDQVRLLESVAGQAAIAIENARLHQQMVRLSLTDALTGVHNRRSLFARLEMERERCERFDHSMAVVLVDVDHFKLFNDRFGHVAGDGVLRQVADIIAGASRRVDLVARYGGEEFAVVLPRADRAAALAAGEKLRAAVEAAAIPHGGVEPARITISVGVATWPEDTGDLAGLIDAADAALYAAKRTGRNTVCAHEPGMRTHPGRKRDILTTGNAETG
jgi:diguanylate cyclase (GGDEF)-like protein